MIPSDLASRLRLVSPDLPAAPQPVTPTRQLTDVLSELSPGQRIMAEIQALLPNGMYRAVVAQREITLALPFSAKAGDTLELEVTETDGKLSLAFVANRSSSEAAEQHSNESVSTTLSKAGNLIGNLLNEVEQQGGRAKPAALNANQPLVANFPENPADLVPILKDSLAKSGMFYEAHQARWVEGKLPTASLLQEPQGKLSLALQYPAQFPAISPEHGATLANAIPTDAEIAQHNQPPQTAEKIADAVKPFESGLAGRGLNETATRESALTASAAFEQSNAQRISTPIHADLNPIVQQQLNALATQTYVWQGQVWPGQAMHWEITEDGSRQASPDDPQAARWQTRLRLDLPALGGIEATLRLGASGNLELSLLTDSEASQEKLKVAGENLNQSLKTAGLQLSHFVVSHGEISR